MGTIHPEEKHPISRFLIRIYDPVAAWSLRWKWVVIAGALALMIATIPVYFKLGSEFMPPLEEGSILYMPTTMPGISITEAQKVLQVTDRIIKQFPEVDHVLGKAGRAETSTDPAPLSMLETVIILKPKAEWRKTETWYSSWAPEWAKAVFRHITPDHISQEELIGQMNDALQDPGPCQRLDHAHQGPDRDAEHRPSHARGAQDHRRRSRHHRRDRRADRIHSPGGAREPAASLRSGPGAAIFSISSGTGRNWPATA